MEKCTKIVLQFYKAVVMGLFAAILFVLGIFSACSTSYINADASEVTLFVDDSVEMNLAAAVGLLVLIFAAKQIPMVQKLMVRVEQEDVCFKRCRNVLLGSGFVIALIWVLSTQYRAGADQQQVQKAVYMLHIKDYSMFAKDGYLSKYPNQLGLVWISYLCSMIFGSYNYLGFQLCNAVCVTVIYKKLAEICGRCGQSKMMQLAVILMGGLFVPLTIYASFIYGNVAGLACSLAAIEYEMAFFETRKKRDLLISAVLIALAVQLKSNYLIFLIGMVIYGGLEMIKEKQVKLLIVPVLLIAFCFGSSMTVKAVTEHVTGYSMDQGVSSWSWIAMGLQEGKRAPGWYNSYNSSSYIKSEFDPAVQAEAAKENIRESLQRFYEDKESAFEFFTKKTASQWNNPTFQAFWNVQVRSSAVTRSTWAWGMTDAVGAHRWSDFLNLYQFAVLVGALGWCIFGRNGKSMEKQTVLAMIFIGGFVFHLFWEAKCQYTISYFVLLIPYAVAGFEAAVEKVSIAIRSLHINQFRKNRKEWADKLLERHFAAIVFAFILVNVCIFGFRGGKLDCLKIDTVDYLNGLEEEMLSPAVEEGMYQLVTEDGRVLGLGAVWEDDIREVGLMNPDNLATTIDSGMEIEVIHYQGDTWLRFVPEQLYLTVTDQSIPEWKTVGAAKSDLSNSQKWKTKKTATGGMYVMFGNEFALTYQKEDASVYVAPFVGDTSQIWYPDAW
ncbi:MAG: hypothetical protein IJ374_02180 [Lachnospiraceae bacterium]|nr:hypothetical protein [Lachnospiraceae bacterium]